MFKFIEEFKRRKQKSKAKEYFMTYINKGFRVYDAYFIHVGDFQGGGLSGEDFCTIKKADGQKKHAKAMACKQWV